MLKDELARISCLVDSRILKCQYSNEQETNTLNSFRSDLAMANQQIRAGWNTAAFSNIPDHSLKRYFHFHLEGIREILDTLHLSCDPNGLNGLLKSRLLDLVQYQRQYFYDYFNYNGVAPLAFCEAVSKSTNETLDILKTNLANAQIDKALKDCIFAYLQKLNFADPDRKYTYGAISYFELFLKEIGVFFITEPAQCLNEALVAKLIGLNFNALDFFCYRKQEISAAIRSLPAAAQLSLLNNEIEALTLADATRLIYDPCLPSLQKMFYEWLREEAAIVKKTSCMATAGSEKLSLNLSVAHLACITRLFFEENIYNTPALTGVFKFIAGHYQTKRQTRISTGSLSKEYYSISQVTAAVVRDKLLKMVSRLNREYFPAMAAISAATLLYSALR